MVLLIPFHRNLIQFSSYSHLLYPKEILLSAEARVPCGVCVGSVWCVHGFCAVCVWVPCGVCMVSVWCAWIPWGVHRFRAVCACVPCGVPGFPQKNSMKTKFLPFVPSNRYIYMAAASLLLQCLLCQPVRDQQTCLNRVL
jgi:hypothetical protein